jgi:hypothetical protein
MPMGGFSGTVPEPTLATVQNLVRTGQLRFFLIDGTGGGAGAVAGFALGGHGAGAAATIDSWVQSSCSTVPAANYQAVPGTAGSGLGGLGNAGALGAGGPGAAAQTLYVCPRSA